MNRIHYIAALLLFSSVGHSAGDGGPKKNCASVLGQASPRFMAQPEPEITDPGAKLRQEIEGLKNRVADAQGMFNHDPFLWEVDIGGQMEVWNRLNGAFPGLHKVREEVWKAHRAESPLPEWLITETKAGVERAIKSGDEDALHGAQIALSRLQEIGNRDRRDQPPPPPKNPDNKDKKKDSKDKKAGEPDGEPEPPRYPPKVKKYQPHNKPADQKGGGKPQAPPVSIARINEPNLGYFRTQLFNMLSKREGWYTVPVNEAHRRTHSPQLRHEMELRTLDQKGIESPLIVPAGYLPIETKGAQGSVWKEPDGNWLVKTNEDVFRVPMVKQGDASRPLSPHEMEIYTSPSGYQLSDWPVELQGEVVKVKEAFEKGQINQLDAARILSSYIAKKFIYTMDGGGTQDVSAIVKGGKFQCDTAATLLTSLMRDELKIPTRLVGGLTGYTDPFNPNFSHAVAPSEAHAWVEVADKDGNWHGFDPTPTKKDRESENGKQESRFQPIPRGEKNDEDKKEQKDKKDQKGQPGGKPEKSKGEGSSPSGEKQPGQSGSSGSLEDEIARQEKSSQGDTAPSPSDSHKSVKDLIKETKEIRDKMEKEQSEGKDGKKTKDGKPGDKATTDHGDQSENKPPTEFEKNDKDIPDDFMKKLQTDNPFVQRLVKKMIAWALDERLDGRSKMERLNRLYAAMGGKNAPSTLVEAKKRLIDAAELFSGDHPPTDIWLKDILAGVEKRPLNDTVDELTKLHRQLQFTLQFLEDKEALPLRNLANEIAKLRRKLATMKHKDSEKIRIVEELRDNLPGQITREILEDDYMDNTPVGANAQTVGLAKKIVSGQDAVLQDLRMISALGAHTDFLVDPVFLPSGGVRNTVFRELLPRKTPKVLMPTTDPRDRNRGVYNLNPNVPLSQAMRRGEAVVMGRRVQVKEPTGFKDVDPEKMTILAVDTSGSMSGAKADFQADYVAALVDRALSDVNPMGKARHRVFILPFNTEVGEPIEVFTAEQAKALIKSRGKGIRRADGGTEIQTVLVKAAGMIKAAGEEPDRKQLSRANVVLCSDGGSSVDYAKVNDAFTAGRGTNEELRIKFGFVAIGETNPDLVKLAKESEQLGADQGMYLEWDNTAISHLQSSARQVPVPKNDFWTDQTYAQAPTDVKAGFMALRSATGAYASSLLTRSAADTASTPTLDWLKTESNELRPDRPDQRKQSHRGSLWAFREALDAVGPIFEPAERTRMLERALRDWRTVVSEPMRSLDNHEIAQILHMLRWPVTGSANIVAMPQAPGTK